MNVRSQVTQIVVLTMEHAKTRSVPTNAHVQMDGQEPTVLGVRPYMIFTLSLSLSLSLSLILYCDKWQRSSFNLNDSILTQSELHPLFPFMFCMGS